MPRSANPDLTLNWKVTVPATVAGSVEHELMDPVTRKPRYGERSKLITFLLADWLEKRRGSRIEVSAPASDLLPKETPQ